MAGTCLPQFPALHKHLKIQLSHFTEEKLKAPKRQKDSLNAQSQPVAELGLKARLKLLCVTHTHVQLFGTACLHGHKSSQDLEKYQFCSSQDLTREFEKWKQLVLSFVTGPVSLIPTPTPCWLLGQGQRSQARWKVGLWNAQGTGQAAIGNQSQFSEPSASSDCCEKSSQEGEEVESEVDPATQWGRLFLFLHKMTCSFLVVSLPYEEDCSRQRNTKGGSITHFTQKRIFCFSGANESFFFSLGLFAAKVWLQFCKVVSFLCIPTGCKNFGKGLFSSFQFSLTVPTGSS